MRGRQPIVGRPRVAAAVAAEPGAQRDRSGRISRLGAHCGHAEPHAATIRVLDSGAGPRGDLVERLFEPFTTGKPEGIGLGLSVAKRIAEAHGGTIRYTRVGATCFEVQLPRGIAVSETASRQPGTMPPPTMPLPTIPRP